MATWALVLVMLIGGERHEFVADYGMTIEDCAAAMMAVELTDQIVSVGCEKEI